MKTVDIPCENKNELVTQAVKNKWINLLNILTRSRWDFYFERFFKFGRFMIITAGGFCLLIYMFSKIKNILQPSVIMQSLTELQILDKALDRPFLIKTEKCLDKALDIHFPIKTKKDLEEEQDALDARFHYIRGYWS